MSTILNQLSSCILNTCFLGYFFRNSQREKELHQIINSQKEALLENKLLCMNIKELAQGYISPDIKFIDFSKPRSKFGRKLLLDCEIGKFKTEVRLAEITEQALEDLRIQNEAYKAINKQRIEILNNAQRVE